MTKMKTMMRENAQESAKLQDEYDIVEKQIEANGQKRVKAEVATNEKIASENQKMLARLKTIQSQIDDTAGRRSELVAKQAPQFYKSEYDTKLQSVRDLRAQSYVDLQTLQSSGAIQDTTKINSLLKIAGMTDKAIAELLDKQSKPLQARLKTVTDALSIMTAQNLDKQTGIEESLRKVDAAESAWKRARVRRMQLLVQQLESPAQLASYDKEVKSLNDRRAKMVDGLNKANKLPSPVQEAIIQEIGDRLRYLGQLGGTRESPAHSTLKEKAEGFAKYAEDHIKAVQKKIKVIDDAAKFEIEQATKKYNLQREQLRAQVPTSITDTKRRETLNRRSLDIEAEMQGLQKKIEARIDTAKQELQLELAKTSPKEIGNIKRRISALNKQLDTSLEDFAKTRIELATRQLSTLDDGNKTRLDKKTDVSRAFEVLEENINDALAVKVGSINDQTEKLSASLQDVYGRLPIHSVEASTHARDMLQRNLLKLKTDVEKNIQTAANMVGEAQTNASRNIATLEAEGRKDSRKLHYETPMIWKALQNVRWEMNAAVTDYENRKGTKAAILKGVIENGAVEAYRKYIERRMVQMNDLVGRQLLAKGKSVFEVARLQKEIDSLEKSVLTVEQYTAEQIAKLTKELAAFNYEPRSLVDFRRREVELSRALEGTRHAIETQIGDLSDDLRNTTNGIARKLAGVNGAIAKSLKRTEKELKDAELRLQFAEKLGGQDPREHFANKAQQASWQVGGTFAAMTGVFAAGREGAQDRREIMVALANTSIGEVGNTAKDFAAFTAKRDEIVALIQKKSIETGKPVKELADAFREAENIAGSTTEAIRQWDVAVKGSVATGASFVAVTRMTSGLMKLFPEEFLSAAQAMNVSSLAARKSPLEFESMAKAIGNVSAVAKIAGIDAIEMVGALQQLSQAQLDSPEAATQFRNMTLRISNPTKAVKKELAALDAQTKNTGKSLTEMFTARGLRENGLLETMERIQEVGKLTGRTYGELAQALLPNLRGTIGASIIFESPDKLRKAIEDLKNAKDDSSFTDAAYKENIESTATQMDIAAQKTRFLATQLSTALLPSVRALNTGISSLVNIVNTIPPGVQSFLLSTGLLGGSIFGLSRMSALAANGLGALASMFTLGSLGSTAFGTRAATLAAFIATKLNPIVAITTTVLGLAIGAWGMYANKTSEAEAAMKKLAEQTKVSTSLRVSELTATKNSIVGLSNLTTTTGKATSANKDTLKTQLDILNNTGILLLDTDTKIERQKKLAEAYRITNQKMEQQRTLSFNAFYDASPDKKAAFDAINKVYDAEKRIKELRERINNAPGIRQGQFYNPTEESPEVKAWRKEVEELENELPKFVLRKNIAKETWEKSLKTELNKFNPQSQRPKPAPKTTEEFEAGRKEREKAEKERLKAEKRDAADKYRSTLSQLDSSILARFNSYKDKAKEEFVLTKKGLGELGKYEAEAVWMEHFQNDPIKLALDRIDLQPSTTIPGQFQRTSRTDFDQLIKNRRKFYPNLDEANKDMGHTLDAIVKQNKELAIIEKQMEKERDHRLGLETSIENMMYENKDSETLPEENNYYARRLEKFLKTRNRDYGLNLDAINNEPDLAKRSIGQLKVDLARQQTEELDLRNESGKGLVAGLKKFFDVQEELTTLKKKLFREKNPKNDLETLLDEVSGGKYQSFADIEDSSLRLKYESDVKEIQTLRLLTETNKTKKQLADDLVRDQKKQGEDLISRTKNAKGKLRLLGATDYDTFQADYGTTEAELAKDGGDIFGAKRLMLRELFRIEEQTKKAKEVYDRLKSLQKKNKIPTGNIFLDRVNSELDQKERFKTNLTKIESGFERAVSTGLKSGFKSGVRDMLDQLKENIFGLISQQLAKGLFEQVRKTGVFDKLFNYKGLSEDTESALSNPESFAQALASKTLSVNVMNLPPQLQPVTPIELPQQNTLNTMTHEQGTELVSQSLSFQEYLKSQQLVEFPSFDSQLANRVLKVEVVNQPSYETMTEQQGKEQYQSSQISESKWSFNRSIGIAEGIGYLGAARAAQKGSLAGAAHAVSGIAKVFGAKALYTGLTKLSPYLAANEALGNPFGKFISWQASQLFGSHKSVYQSIKKLPLGKQLGWAAEQLFGSKLDKNRGRKPGVAADGWGNPNGRVENAPSRAINVNMPNANIVQPSDATYLATEVGRVLRSSPSLAGV